MGPYPQIWVFAGDIAAIALGIDPRSIAAIFRGTPVPSAVTSCSNGSITAVPGGRSLSITGADVAANASCAVSVNVTARAGTYVNDADDLSGSAYLDTSPAKDILTVEDDGSVPATATPVASLSELSIVALSLVLLGWAWRNRRRLQR